MDPASAPTLTRAFVRLFFMLSLPQMAKEKKLRKGHHDGFLYAQSLGKFSGVNVVAGRGMSPRTPDSLTPARGIRKLDSFNHPVPDISTNIQSLAQWVSSVKPGAIPHALQQAEGLRPRNPGTHRGRMSSVASVGMISEAGSRWGNHGRLDSCAASAWGGVHISDVESSVHGDEGDGESSLGEGPWHQERSRSSGDLSRSEWNGLGQTIDDFGRSIGDMERSAGVRITASSTFFNDLQVPDQGDDYDNDEPDERSPGGMTAAGSAWGTPQSRAAGGGGGTESPWDDSPAPSPAGADDCSTLEFVSKRFDLFAVFDGAAVPSLLHTWYSFVRCLCSSILYRFEARVFPGPIMWYYCRRCSCHFHGCSAVLLCLSSNRRAFPLRDPQARP